MWLHARLQLDAVTQQASVQIESQTDAIPLTTTPDLSALQIELGIHFPQTDPQEAYFDDLVCTAD